MFKIKFGDQFISTIDNFIDGYLNSYLDLFIDSGIKNLSEIIENYETLAFNFRNTIFIELNSFFTKEKIFGFTKISTNSYYTYIIIGNYRLKIFYKENNIERKLFKIEFHKK